MENTRTGFSSPQYESSLSQLQLGAKLFCLVMTSVFIKVVLSHVDDNCFMKVVLSHVDDKCFYKSSFKSS